MLKAISTLLILTGAAPALAQASGDSKPNDPNRIVCERYQETGSRLGSREVCKTVREWEEYRTGTKSTAKQGSQSGSSKATAN